MEHAKAPLHSLYVPVLVCWFVSAVAWLRQRDAMKTLCGDKQECIDKLRRLQFLVIFGALLGAGVLSVTIWKSGQRSRTGAVGLTATSVLDASASAGVHALKAAPRCGVFEYKSVDPTPFQHMPIYSNPSVGAGQRYRHLRVLLDQRGKYKQVQIPETCAEQLRSQGVSQLRVINHLKTVEYSVYDGTPDHCTYFNGTWFMLSHAAGEQLLNIFDRLSTEWYHMWLVRKRLFSQHEGPLFITHMNGNRGGTSHPFLPIYRALGEYRQWEDLGVAEAGCLEFEDVLMWSTSWVHIANPVVVPESGGGPLQEFVDAVLEALDVASVQPDSCPRLALYSARENHGKDSRRARWVLNADQVLAAMKETLQGFYEVQRVNMAKMEFVESMRLMRRASIYVFPHGGSGPNLLWMRRGTVAVELFPYKSADPMYRNLAALTGKVYLSWQAQEFAEKGAKVGQPGYIRAYEPRGGYHFNSKSAFNVTVEELMPLLQSAAWVVKGNQGDGWTPSNAHAFHTYLCPWSDTTYSYKAWTACGGGKRGK